MQLFDTISGPGGRNLKRIAKNLDLSESETSAVLHSVMPEIRRFLERRTLSRGGLADVVRSLGDAGQGRFLKPDTDLNTDAAIENGNAWLDQIVETKYRSRAIADRTEAETGVPAEKIRRMLPRIANVSMAAVAQQTRPALEDIFRKMPGFPGNAAPSTPSSNGSPLPLPDDNWGSGSRDRSGYDDLSDVLTRRQRPGQSNPLWSIVREVLGSVLGFQSKGIMGYIIRFIVMRYGWTILRTVFGRMLRI